MWASNGGRNTMVLTVKLQRLPHGEGLPLPNFMTAGAAGADICAAENFNLWPGNTIIVPTGFAVEVPEGYELQIRSRSGLSAKRSIIVTNGIGTIDSDYRGEILVILSRLDWGKEPDPGFKRGERIAQLVLKPVTQAQFEEVSELSVTARGVGGQG